MRVKGSTKIIPAAGCRFKHGRKSAGLLLAAAQPLLLLLLAALLVSCGNPYEKSKQKRAEKAGSKEADIVIAVVWPHLKPAKFFPQGADLAVEEINTAGGVLGRRLRAVHYRYPEKHPDRFDAGKIAKDHDIVAVVGHFYSANTLSAIITYEVNGILFLVAAATNPLLLEQGFEYIFRPIPNDRDFARQLAWYAHLKGYQRIVIIDNGTLYGIGLADNFYRHATDLQLDIIIQRGYLQTQNDFRSLIAAIMKLKFDAVLVAGILPQAGWLIKQLRQMGVKAPIIASDALDSQNLIDIAGDAADGIVVPYQAPAAGSSPAYLKFRAAFLRKYNHDPDLYAARGYDFIKMLAHVMNANGSAVPIIVAANLRHTLKWQGILGAYSFKENGELSKSTIEFKEIRNGQFATIEE